MLHRVILSGMCPPSNPAGPSLEGGALLNADAHLCRKVGHPSLEAGRCPSPKQSSDRQVEQCSEAAGINSSNKSNGGNDELLLMTYYIAGPLRSLYHLCSHGGLKQACEEAGMDAHCTDAERQAGGAALLSY